MKLFRAGLFMSFKPIYTYVAAESADEAIKMAQEKLGINYLPFEAYEVKVDGYIINLIPEKKAKHEPKKEPVNDRKEDVKPEHHKQENVKETKKYYFQLSKLDEDIKRAIKEQKFSSRPDEKG